MIPRSHLLVTHPPQKTWCVPKHLQLGTYTNMVSISSSVWVLWTCNILCATVVLSAYQYTVIFNKSIQFTKEKYIDFISQKHSWLSTQTTKVHTNLRCAYRVQGEDGTWCLSDINIKIVRTQKRQTPGVCYRAFTVKYCFLPYLFLPRCKLRDFKWNIYVLL